MYSTHFKIVRKTVQKTLRVNQALCFIFQFLHEGDDTGEEYCNSDGSVRTYDVAGVLGPSSSSSAIFVSRMLALQQIASFSTWATSDELSDKGRFPYFMRVVPPDSFQVRI